MQGDSGSGRPERGSPSTPDHRSTPGHRTLRIGIVGLALLVGVIAWVATRGDDGSSAESSASETRIVSVEELEEFASSAGRPVYWAGPIDGKELELSEGVDGNVQIRYLDEGTEAGGGSPAVLTVGTYALPDAAGALEGFASREGSVVREDDEVGEVVFSNESPTSVYFASPEGDVQVEVYDPAPERALNLALSGVVQPVG
jgi:hypothetical protein